MSHAESILVILEREARRLAAREARYSALRTAIRHSHASGLRSAELIEAAETLVRRIAAAKVGREQKEEQEASR